MAAAAQQAAKTGKPVAVQVMTTDTQQVMAQPSGGFTLSINPKPVRTLQRGAWVPVDTKLHPNADGTLSPAATAEARLTFSGGGSGPLVTTTSGGASYSVSWSHALPKPRVAGTTATYANVLPGVDLQLSATVDGGFSDVLVVHNAAAAKNPALARLILPTKVAGGRLGSDGHGGVQLTDQHGDNTLTDATPFMWDSNTTPVGPTSKAKLATPDPSDAAHPGMAAHLSQLRARTSPSALTLLPDKSLLSGRSTVFPVYIDPTFNWHPTDGGTPAFDEVKRGEPCTNSSFFDNSGDGADDGALGVGYNQFESCFGPQRAYYQWKLPSVIWGAHIGNVSGQPGAVVDVQRLFSQFCGQPPAAVTLHVTGGIGPGTSWNSQPGAVQTVSSYQFPQATNSHCPGAQPSHGYDVTAQIAALAKAHATQFTVALTGDESSGSEAFGRFSDNPTLQISYNHAPSTPGPNQMNAATGAENAGCATATPYPYMGKTITTNTPVLSSVISDPDTDHLQATFKYWIDGTTTTATGLSGDSLASGSKALFSLPSSFVSSLTNGKVVDWQVQVSDGEDTSGWSQVCHFIAEPQAPSAPSITSADGKYPNDGTVGAVAGTPGRFSFASTGGAVTSIVDNLDQAPPTSNPPAADKTTFNGGGQITPAGRWRFTDGSGSTTVVDEQGAHPFTLGSGATWASDSTKPTFVSFNGTSAGDAVANGPVLNTVGSFTVGAWVKLNATSSNFQTAVSQDGSEASGFYLQYDATDNAWAFARVSSDTANATGIRAHGTTAPALNTWTYLTGVYDAANSSLTLYVNGTQVGTATDSTPEAAPGSFVVGRGLFNGAPSDFFNGSVADVQVYQAALAQQQIQLMSQGTSIKPGGRWRFLDGSGTTSADSSGNNQPVTLNGGATWSTSGNGGVVLDGSTGYAQTTTASEINPASSYSVGAWVNLTSNARFATAVSEDGPQYSVFFLQYDQLDNAWAFAQLDPPGTTTAVRAKSTTAAALNTWTYLTATYNAGTGAMTLYVNGKQAGTATDTTPASTFGQLTIGRAFYQGANSDFWPGQITDVQTYPGVLGPSAVAQLYSSSTLPLTPLAPGPHTLWGYTADAAGDASGYQTYQFVANQDPNTACTSLSACYDNTGISPDSNHSLGNFDGVGNSFSATDLNNAGWTSSGNLMVDGARFTLPQFGSGQPDNALAANQKITFSQPIAKTGSSALEFLTSASYAGSAGGITPGAIAGDDTSPAVPAGTAVADTYCFTGPDPTGYCAPHGTIEYADGQTQTYYLTVPDWSVGPESIDTAWFPHENQPGGQSSTNPKMYAFSVPLLPSEAGKSIAFVDLPDVGTQVGAGKQALHIFSMATRDTSIGLGVTDGTGQTWTGAWAAPSEGVFNYGSSYNDQTIRETITPSVSGNSIRLKFDNALGVNPLNIGAATIAPESFHGSPVPSGTLTKVSFDMPRVCPGGGGCPVFSTTVPEGGMVYSVPISIPVTAGQPLLVSFELTNTVPFLVSNSEPGNGLGEWISASGSGDQTGDTTGTPFTGTGTTTGAASSVVTDLDVETSGTPTEAVLGDGFIDQSQTGHTPTSNVNLIGDLGAAASTITTPYGIVGEGMEANQLTKDYPEPNGSGPAALSRLDRDILDQPGLTTVVVDEGLEDILAGDSANDLNSGAFTELINDFTAQQLNVILVGLTPCDGYTGDGATPNDQCTSTVDNQRTALNGLLSSNPDNSSPFRSPSPVFYIDSDHAIGVPDSSNGEMKLATSADGGDHVNLTNAGYAALASAYLGPQDTWPINDGTDDPTTTTFADLANNATNPYLINNPQAGNNPAQLNGNAPNWVNDTTRGEVLDFDGTTNYAETSGQVLNTSGSFTVSAWVKLDKGDQTGVIVSQIGTNGSAFTLRYDTSEDTDSWSFTTLSTDEDNADNDMNWADSLDDITVGQWVQVAASYNAQTHTMWVYTDGQPEEGFSSDGITPFNATGPLVIGADQENGVITNLFPGEISNVQAWNYTLDDQQIQAFYDQIGPQPAN